MFKLTFNETLAREVMVDAATRRLDRAGAEGLEVARSLVPVDTGKLKASLGYYYRQSDATLVLYAGTDYAPYVELGTSRMAPRPYLRPGIYAAAEALGGYGSVAMAFPGAEG